MSGVVEQLVLGRAPIDVIVFFGAAIKNSGVTARAQFPVESKLEVSKLISGDDVLDGAGLGQHAIDDAPAGRQCLPLVSAPGRGGSSIEERSPAGGALFSGQISSTLRRRARSFGLRILHL